MLILQSSPGIQHHGAMALHEPGKCGLISMGDELFEKRM